MGIDAWRRPWVSARPGTPDWREQHAMRADALANLMPDFTHEVALADNAAFDASRARDAAWIARELGDVEVVVSATDPDPLRPTDDATIGAGYQATVSP